MNWTTATFHDVRPIIRICDMVRYLNENNISDFKIVEHHDCYTIIFDKDAGKEPLTKKQARVLAFIKDWTNKNGSKPTYSQMCEGLNLKSDASVTQYLEALKSKGYL